MSELYLGYTTAGYGMGNTVREMAYAFDNAIAAADGNITSFSVYGGYNDEACDLRLGLFSDDSGGPKDLLDYTAIFTVNSAVNQWWVSDAILGYHVVKDTPYWVAILHPTQEIAGSLTTYGIYSGATRKHIDMGTVNQFNDPWSGTTPGTTANFRLSLYATYTEGDGHVTNPGGDINWARTRALQ